MQTARATARQVTVGAAGPRPPLLLLLTGPGGEGRRGQRGPWAAWVGAEGCPGRPTRCPPPSLRVGRAWQGGDRTGPGRGRLRVRGGAGHPRFGALAIRSECWGVSSRPRHRGLGAGDVGPRPSLGVLRPGSSPIPRGGRCPPRPPRPGPTEAAAATVHDPVHVPVPPSDSQAGTPWACSGDTKKPRSSYRGDSGVQDTRASPAHLGPTALPAGLGDVGSGSWLADGGHSASEAKSRGFWGGGWGEGRPTKAPLVTVAHPRQGSPERGGSLVDPQTAGAGHQVPAPSDLWQG